MKRLVVGLLLATLASGPVAAQAQENEAADGRARARPRGEGPRLTPEQRQERRAERAERRAERTGPGPVADRPRPAVDRPNRRLDGDGERLARPDRMLPRREGQIFPPVREQRRDLREVRREARDEYPDRRIDRRQGRDVVRNGGWEGRRDPWGDRRDARQNWRADHHDDRDHADRGRGAYSGPVVRGAYGGGAVWNRGWRDDRRYDWNRYRENNRGFYRLPRYYAPVGFGYGYRRFGLGATLSRSLFGSAYWLEDPWAYRLPPAYGAYRWVRYYDDALLIDLRTGRVIDTVYDIFY